MVTLTPQEIATAEITHVYCSWSSRRILMPWRFKIGLFLDKTWWLKLNVNNRYYSRGHVSYQKHTNMFQTPCMHTQCSSIHGKKIVMNSELGPNVALSPLSAWASPVTLNHHTIFMAVNHYCTFSDNCVKSFMTSRSDHQPTVQICSLVQWQYYIMHCPVNIFYTFSSPPILSVGL